MIVIPANRKQRALALGCTFISLIMFGCADDDPKESASAPSAGMSASGGSVEAGGQPDQGTMPNTGGMVTTPTCTAKETDYPGSTWSMCISDDGVYHQINQSVSSIGRVESFEKIADLLWRKGSQPSGDDFTDARIEYALMEGLDSRVRRRYDSHIDKPEDGSSCRDAGPEVLEAYPDYCVGPARIEPLLSKAFIDGSQGIEPHENAARVEAGLLWFLYVSTYKEANTCASAKKDCDSTWAYYSGGRQKDDGIGLAGYVRSAEPDTHARVFDGILAIRCWRDLDVDEPSTDDMMHQKALGQLDAALDRALVSILIDRVRQWQDSEGPIKNAHWAFLQVLGPVADRLIRTRDAAAANSLKDVWSSDGKDITAKEVVDDLNAAVSCP